MSTERGKLITIEGVDGKRMAAAAKAALKGAGRRRSGISRWDASGLFDQLKATDLRHLNIGIDQTVCRRVLLKPAQSGAAVLCRFRFETFGR